MLCLCSLFSRKRRANRSPYGQEPGPRPYNQHAPGLRPGYGPDTTLDEKKEKYPRPADSLQAQERHLLSPLSPETPASPDAKWNPGAQAASSSRPYSKGKDEGVGDPEKQSEASRAEAARRKAAQEEQERLDFFQMM